MDADVVGRARWRRTVLLLVAFVLVELGLAFVVHLAPAMRVLMRPVYVVVAIAFLFTLYAATRRRHGDRRHGERRQPDAF
jgi:hypothetical protein